jgi:hypothetical protein
MCRLVMDNDIDNSIRYRYRTNSDIAIQYRENWNDIDTQYYIIAQH